MLMSSVSDMFPPGTTDIPTAISTLAPLIGPCAGPLLGGFINQNVTWRATFYLMIGWSGITLVLLYFLVPETFLPIIQSRAARAKRIQTNDGRWYAPSDRNGRRLSDVFPGAVWVPIRMLLVERMALALNMWTALVLGIIYLFFNAIPYTFRTIYNLYVPPPFPSQSLNHRQS